MITDARTHPPPSRAVAWDVCIVGAGPAGMTVAMELAGSGLDVCLLEAGGWGYDREVQRLNEGTVEGNTYPPLRNTRLSAFGGSTKLWAGWCRPLDPVDFEPREWVDGSGWPFSRDELVPHYERAHAICRLGPFEYDPEFWSRRTEVGPLPLDPRVAATTMFHVNMLSFGDAYRSDFEGMDDVRVVLHASAMRLNCPPTGDQIESVTVRSMSGREFDVRARTFVLAGGGIENARILLLSGDTPERAVGNVHGLVGRYFTEHAFIHPGSFVPAEPRRSMAFHFPMSFEEFPPEASVRAGFSLARPVLERERLLNAAFVLRPAHEGHPVFDSREVTAMLELWEKVRGRGVPGSAFREMRTALRSPRRLALAAWRKLTVRGPAAARWGLRAFFEGESLPSNRITLSRACDRFGRPLPHIEWRLSELDLRSVRSAFHHLDRAMRESGLGRFELRFADEPEAWNAAAFGGKHHMGTTRMNASPSRGVVDPDGKVHGIHNLYVTGSSVFPTSGFANPTLTIVALAARLGTHLRTRLRR